MFVKIMYCKSVKEIWDKIQNTYEGDKKVKEAKLQTHRGHFEQLNMMEENIVAYFLRVEEVLNVIEAPG